MNRELLFGDNFKKYRKRRGISQKEFAQLLYDATGKRLTLTSVSNYETGMHMPPPQVLPVIAQILEVSIDALFGFGKDAPVDTASEQATFDFDLAEEERAQAELQGPDVVREWKQELESLEREFIYWKASKENEMRKGTAVAMAVEYADKVTELAKKQQEELTVLQTELATIKEMLSIFRK